MVQDGIYGWHRNPTTNAGTLAAGNISWGVQTNLWSYKKDAPYDVSVISFRQPGQKAHLTRDLTSPSTAPLTTWNFAATINYGNKYYLSNYPNVREETDADSYGQYLDILDDADKVIARFNPKDIGGNVHTLQGNGVTIMSAPVSSGGYDPLSFVSKQSIPTRLSISAQNGLITFTYGSYAPVTRPVFDSTANWQNPRTLRLHFWTGSNATGYRQAIALGEATFSPAPTVSEMPAPPLPPPPFDGFNVATDKGK